MKRLLLMVLLAAGVGMSAPARAFVPQTITIDGINDFNPANQLDDDRGDTQSGCSPAALPMDLGRVYVTNDANYLYFGIEFSKTCYCDMNLGMAIDVNTAAGGVTDPFGRQIGWANVPFKPDWVVYDVTPTNCNTFNYEVLYKDSLGTWLNKSTSVNPTWGSGSNGLGIFDSTTFREVKLPLSTLGASTGTPLHLEFWVTQEGATKGPLDALCSDNVQMSRFSQTTYDTNAVVQMTCMLNYTVLNSVDLIPPTVTSAQALNFTVLGNKQFSLTTTKVDVTFSENVDLATAQTTTNYALSGAAVRTISSAVRDPIANNVVHLTLNGVPIGANAAFYDLTVTNVKDASPAGNTIVANGSTNVGSFFIENVQFDDNVRLRLCKGEFAVTDSFYVEGSLLPLTFAVGDNGRQLDANSDSIYSVTVPFCVPKDRATGKAVASLDWKFSHTPAVDAFEPGANRTYTLSSDSGSVKVVSASWANDNPANFTTKSVDVIFKVNAASLTGPPTPHKVWLVGSALPLTFTRPGQLMKDDGVPPDQTAGDKIYTLKIRFPRCTPKDVTWKVVYDSTVIDTVFECLGQGDRDLYVNDAVFDTAGSVQGPITLPARGINRCQITDKAVAVTFRVLMSPVSPLPGASDTVAVIGNHSPRVTSPAHAFPMTQAWPPLAGARLFDNGVPPDATSGDGQFTRTLVFPESTGVNVNFKYWLDRNFECSGSPDRTFKLDDVGHSVASPMVRNLDVYSTCRDLVDVPIPANPADAVAAFGILRQSFPNPAAARMSIRFDLKQSGRVSLRVFDVTGRRISTLVDRALEAGPHEVSWNGRDAAGKRLPSGVYVYELAMGGERLTRRLVVTQ